MIPIPEVKIKQVLFYNGNTAPHTRECGFSPASCGPTMDGIARLYSNVKTEKFPSKHQVGRLHSEKQRELREDKHPAQFCHH